MLSAIIWNLLPAGIAALTALPLALAMALNLPPGLPIRQRLGASKWKFLACAIPFGPALTALVFTAGYRHVPAFVHPLGLMLGIAVSSYLASACAACWLCISKEPTRQIRVGSAVVLTYLLWLFGTFALGVLGALPH